MALALGAALGFAAAYLPGLFRPEPVALAAAPPPPAAVLGGLATHRLLDEVVGRIQREYVDEVPARAFDEAAVEGIVANLDPHSAFLDAREYDEMRATTTGSY